MNEIYNKFLIQYINQLTSLYERFPDLIAGKNVEEEIMRRAQEAATKRYNQFLESKAFPELVSEIAHKPKAK